ncbi:MAG: spermidine synthase [Candidatus Hydrogenedentes bacterium]|nr:spermidine synthase [Candidatus Hydrogenedentota bacterium]
MRTVCRQHAIALSLPLFVAWGALGEESDPKVILDTNSQYHRIFVTEEPGDVRNMHFDTMRWNITSVRMGHPEEMMYYYLQTMLAGFAYLPETPRDVLCVGLGGGSLPMFLRHFWPEMNIDAAEIDPEVARVAQEYMGFAPDANMKVSSVDGRMFLRRTARQYDAIFLDAYNTNTSPFHLTTREFFEIVKERLKPDGVVVSHIWSPQVNEFHYAELATHLAVFGQVDLFAAKDSDSVIFIANREGKTFPLESLVSRAEAIMAEKKLPFDLVEIVRGRSEPVASDLDGVSVLTDDHAPVDLLRNQSRGE